ncbi:MAG: hypothetical protein KIPDCIKN_03863 [Haliscomenobacter sp.]|nr:hypothetical protein [Haliscomenobacter sp.]
MQWVGFPFRRPATPPSFGGGLGGRPVPYAGNYRTARGRCRRKTLRLYIFTNHQPPDTQNIASLPTHLPHRFPHPLVFQRFPQVVEVPLMVEVGAEVVGHTEADELFGGLLDGAVVISAQGEDIDLEAAAEVFEALVFAEILVEEAVAFRVGQDGGIAFGAQAEDVVFQFGWRAEERHLHQYVVIPEGKQGLAGGEEGFEVVVEVILGGGVELHGDVVFPQGGAHLFELAQYDFPGIRVVF